MWYKKLMRYLWIPKETPVLEVASLHPPYRKDCVALIKKLNPLYWCHYESSIGLSIKIDSLYPNIELYTKKLKEITKFIKQEKTLASDLFLDAEINVSVDRFIISNDGFYIDVRIALSEFLDAALYFCAAMEKADTETYGIYEHNLRMLTKLFINLKHVLKQLNEVIPK